MATFIVTTTADENNIETAGAPALGSGLSLREALALSNANPDDDIIQFDPTVFGDARVDQILLTNGELTISQNVIIDGDTNGDDKADVTISGNNASRIFNITTDNLSASFFSLALVDADVSGNGGAINVASADDTNVTVRDTTFAGNTANRGGAISISGASTLMIDSSLIFNNLANQFGGGIHAIFGATISAIDTTIDQNSALFNGGGVFGYSGADFTFVNATITRNTVAENTATIDAGGGFDLTNNTLTLINSVVAENVSGNAGTGNDVTGVVDNATHSFFETAVTITTDTNSINGSNDATGLGALQDNGGTTFTRNIESNSPLVNAGTLNTGVNNPTDANGNPRITFTDIDIGAAEVPIDGGFVVTTLDDVLDPFDGFVSLREAILQANSNDTADVITFDEALLGGQSTAIIRLSLDAELTLSSDITIDGDVNGDGIASIVISGDINGDNFPRSDDASTVFDESLLTRNGQIGLSENLDLLVDVTSEGTATLNNIALTGAFDAIRNTGTLTIENGIVSGNTDVSFRNEGTAVLRNTEFFENERGIIAFQSSDLKLESIQVRDHDDEGLTLIGGAATVVNSLFSDNTESGILNQGSDLVLFNSTLSDNGGGLENIAGGQSTIINTTIVRNSGGGSFDGVLNGNGFGFSESVVTLINSTIAGNGSSSSGIGIFTNSNDTTNLTNTIVAGHGGANLDGPGTTNSGPDSLIVADDATLLAQEPRITGDIPDLVDNGALVPTVVLLNDPANPAVDAITTPVILDETVLRIDVNGDGDTNDVDAQLLVDARGQQRGGDPVTSATGPIDVGAVEIQPVPDTLVVTTLLDRFVVNGNFNEDGSIEGATPADAGDAVSELLDGEGLSLREAIAIAEAFDNVERITFDDALLEGNSAAVLRLTSGIDFDISSTFTIDGDLNDDGIADIVISGDLDGDDEMQLDDPSTAFDESLLNAINIDIDDINSIFSVEDGGDLTLEGLALTGTGRNTSATGVVRVFEGGTLTISNSIFSGNLSGNGGTINNLGDATVTNTVISGNRSFFDGGGIYNGSGVLTITGSTITGNSAFSGGGVFNSTGGTANISNTTISSNSITNPSGTAAGISNLGALTLENSTISDHVDGGISGLANSGNAIISRSTISNNFLGRGGVSNTGDLSIFYSTITGNSGERGAGLYNIGNGEVQIFGSAILNNAASVDGGGVFNSGTVALINTTLSGNSAGSIGGAVLTYSFGGAAIPIYGTTSLVNSTVSGNHADVNGGIYTSSDVSYGGSIIPNAANIINSIVVGNYSTNSGVTDETGGPGTLQIDASSIVGGDATLIFAQTQSSNTPGTTFGVVADNGGPVQTIALVNSATNPALDAQTAPFVIDETVVGLDINGDGDALDTDVELLTDARGIQRGQDVTGVGNNGSNFGDIGAFEAIFPSANADIISGSDFDDVLSGFGRGDTIFGLGGNDEIEGGSGGDDIDGGAGIDTATFLTAGAGVVVNLTAGVGTQGNANGDTYVSIENLIGSDHDDTLTGSSGNNAIQGGEGDDRLRGSAGFDELEGGRGADDINGGSGTDTAAFRTAASGVTINLTAGIGTRGDANGDTFTSIENAIGSDFDDILTGTSSGNRLYGGLGDDVLRGSAGTDILIGGMGADELNGGSSVDTASYENAAGGIAANLTSRTGTAGEAAGDTLISIENLLGSDFRDTLTGSSGNNRLNGGAGNDLLRGSAGSDFLQGGLGEDDLNGGSGIDVASYEDAAEGVEVNLTTGRGAAGEARGDILTNVENLIGSRFGDVLLGSAVDNQLEGGAGSDFLAGSFGDDELEGGSGGDVVNGGDGIDTATFRTATGAVVANLTSGVGSQGNANGDTYISIENLTGSRFGDTLTGSSRNNVIAGGAGSDLLRGSAGNDELEGGSGGDDVNGGSGTDTATFKTAGSGVTANLTTGIGTRGNANGDTYTSIENLIGSRFGDMLTGSSGNNIIQGGAGSDTLNGANGNDEIEGGSGGDDIDGGSGTDAATFKTAGSGVVVNLTSGIGTRGNANGDTYTSIENLIGSDFDDTLTGSAGDNVIEGGLGDDKLRGSAGNDQLEGGIGADDINGGSGIDSATFASASSGVTLNLTAGIGSRGDANGDTYAGIENVIGSLFDDFITGSSGDNTLVGGMGDDTLRGSAGDDLLRGGLGNDILNGGSSSDQFRFDTALDAVTNVDTIENYSIGDDIIELDDAIFSSLGSTITVNEFSISEMALDGDDLLIYDKTTGQLFYDPDAAGGADQILFAQLDVSLNLTIADFDIV